MVTPRRTPYIGWMTSFAMTIRSGGSAVSVGHVSFFTTWDTDETTIILALRGDNYEIDLKVVYTSKRAGPLGERGEGTSSLRRALRTCTTSLLELTFLPNLSHFMLTGFSS